MVIRRIREHVAAHNWFAVGIDLAIVVAGVFLGTQVNNWNASRMEANEADAFRERLIDEIEFDEQQYRSQTAYYRRARHYGQAALAALREQSPLSDRDFAIAAYQLTQTDTTRGKRNVYDEMTARGLIGRLGDPETQAMASDFFLSADIAQRNLEIHYPYRDMLRESMPYGLQIRIRRECGDRSLYFRKRLIGVTTVHPCTMTIGPGEARQAAQAIRATPDIDRQMTRYLASLDEKLDNLDVALAQATALRRRLSGLRGDGAA